jgi:tRNA A37 methylthiotransferase MiaB
MATNNQPFAYLKISDGCSCKCSYCTIPAIRGPYHSYSFEQINAQVANLVKQNIKEVILIAQDTGIWASDLPPNNNLSSPRRREAAGEERSDERNNPLSSPRLGEAEGERSERNNPLSSPRLGEAEGERSERNAGDPHTNPKSPTAPQSLAQLLDTLARSYPQTWFRVMYLQPRGVTDELLRVMAAHSNICNYLDIPLQHASPKIIKQMHRSGSGTKYLELLAKIRRELPAVTLRTTLIAGFPGETRSDARQLEQFLQAAQFDYAGVFCYSQEDGTVAGARSDQVPMRTRKARAQRLRDIADTAGFERAEALCGSLQQVLICGEDEDGIYGRTQGQAPDVDGVVYLSGRGSKKLSIGSIVSARITESICYDLYAELVKKP